MLITSFPVLNSPDQVSRFNAFGTRNSWPPVSHSLISFDSLLTLIQRPILVIRVSWNPPSTLFVIYFASRARWSRWGIRIPPIETVVSLWIKMRTILAHSSQWSWYLLSWSRSVIPTFIIWLCSRLMIFHSFIYYERVRRSDRELCQILRAGRPVGGGAVQVRQVGE